MEPLFSVDSWQVALSKLGVDIKDYLEELNEKKVLPWDNIVIGTSKEELRRIYLNRIKYVQENLKDKKEKQVSNISLSISLVTVLFTIIFGLPAIVETCTIFVNNSFIGELWI